MIIYGPILCDVSFHISYYYFSLFGLITVHIYALCILLGIILATWITGRRLTRRGAERGVVLDFLLWVVPLGIIFARGYHVLTHLGDYFGAGKNPMSVFFIWEGGNAIFGALLGGALGVWIASRQTGVRFLSFAEQRVNIRHERGHTPFSVLVVHLVSERFGLAQPL